MESLDELISRTFSISQAESRRLINQGGVRNVNNDVIRSAEEVSDGERLKIGRNRSKTVRKEVK